MQPSLFEEVVPTAQAPQGAFKLRDYQEQAVNKILWAMKLEGNDLLSLPTGAGKSIVIAEIARKINKPLLILQPSKEILEQNMAKLQNYVDKADIGVYSASMSRKDISKYTFATIGSVYQKPELFQHIGIVLLDECHLLNAKNTDGMFTSFLDAIGNPKVIGLTATIYRNVQAYHQVENWRGEKELESKVTLKLINRMKPFFWNRLMFCINPKQLTDQGYLCPLEYQDCSDFDHSEMRLNKSQSDFDLDDYHARLRGKQKQILSDLIEARRKYKSILVFCPTISYAETMAGCVEGAASISSKTPAADRARIIQGFKDGRIQVVFNVGVLTTGFDHPALDCIVLARPTRSVSLYYQMLGRGVRLAPGKTKCVVMDYSGTVKQIGPIESIEVCKDVTGKWNVRTSTGWWHNRMLYSFPVKKKTLATEVEI